MKTNQSNKPENDSPDPVHPDPVHDDVVPVVGAENYAAFDLWMNVQLSQLVARWEYMASPKARHAATQAAFGRRFTAPRKAK